MGELDINTRRVLLKKWERDIFDNKAQVILCANSEFYKMDTVMFNGDECYGLSSFYKFENLVCSVVGIVEGLINEIIKKYPGDSVIATYLDKWANEYLSGIVGAYEYIERERNSDIVLVKHRKELTDQITLSVSKLCDKYKQSGFTIVKGEPLLTTTNNSFNLLDKIKSDIKDRVEGLFTGMKSMKSIPGNAGSLIAVISSERGFNEGFDMMKWLNERNGNHKLLAESVAKLIGVNFNDNFKRSFNKEIETIMVTKSKGAKFAHTVSAKRYAVYSATLKTINL